METLLFGPIDIDQLLLSKQLEPLSSAQIEQLNRVQNRENIDAANETEVRSFIIDPILQVLGYDWGTIFSTSMENQLRFLGQQRRSDYHFQLWNENFWLLEAKRPRVGQTGFEYNDFSQALEYSVHPTVNAALIVLCDGLKIEVFDREIDVERPLVHVDICHLVRDFDKLRAMLEPMQIWFFEKRRIIRQIERVFDKEFVLSRVEEFSDLVERRVRGRRMKILENFRASVSSDHGEQAARAKKADLSELVEHYMMFDYPIPIDNVVNIKLVELCTTNSFPVMRRIFPDQPRIANDSFMSQAVTFLAGLAKAQETINWLPAWLARGSQVNTPVATPLTFMLDQSLSYFNDYEPYRIVLLAANALRRIAKINVIVNEGLRAIAKELNAYARHTLPEFSWAQAISSENGTLVNLIDVQTTAALLNFVSRHNVTDRGNRSFQVESAKKQLRDFWNIEKNLLSGVPNYRKLLDERKLGEMRMTEFSSVTYDNLGHSTLCRLHRFPEWKEYLLKERRHLIETVASTGSWAARDMLGLKPEDPYQQMPDETVAQRFFFGDIDTMRELRAKYCGA